ncbi:MAG: MarR family transcriptional regulator [Actinomycetia bacterium]|nr:MarR family transcriptional regulator [Actinomycetes bacterium]
MGSRMRLVWQWVRTRIYDGVVAAGYDDLNRSHIGVFRFPGIDGLRPSEVAQEMQITKQSVNELLGHLERLGYLVRELDPNDSRARIIRLTNAGRKLERAVLREARAAEAEIAELVGPRRFAQLRTALDELVRLTNPERTDVA